MQGAADAILTSSSRDMTSWPKGRRSCEQHLNLFQSVDLKKANCAVLHSAGSQAARAHPLILYPSLPLPIMGNTFRSYLRYDDISTCAPKFAECLYCQEWCPSLVCLAISTAALQNMCAAPAS